jgi:hypothetical protein
MGTIASGMVVTRAEIVKSVAEVMVTMFVVMR